MLPYPQTRGEDLSSPAPVHRMCQISVTGLTFWNAGLHPDEKLRALKYRACAQNVSDIIHRLHWDAGLRPDEG